MDGKTRKSDRAENVFKVKYIQPCMHVLVETLISVASLSSRKPNFYVIFISNSVVVVDFETYLVISREFLC